MKILHPIKLFLINLFNKVFHHSKKASWVFFWRKFNPKQRQYFELLIGGILMILGPIAIASYLQTPKVQAAWFDDTYMYRQTATLSNSGSAQTDFQVSFTLDTATLITNEKMQSDCDDIRITSFNGDPLPYWIEEGSAPCNSATTKIWVKFPSIPTTNQTLFIYYGNPQATKGSDGFGVFPFFDDFNTGVLNTSKWTATGGTSFANGAITVTTGAIYTPNTVIANGENYYYEQRNSWAATNSSYAGLSISNATSIAGTNANSNKLAVLVSEHNALTVPSFAANGTAASYNINAGTPQFTATAGTNYITGFAIDPTALRIRFYQNRTQTNAYAYTGATSMQSSYYLFLGYFTGSTAGTTNIRDMTTDWVLIRKFATTDPTISSPGSEEKALTPVAYWKLDEGTGNLTSNSNGSIADITTGLVGYWNNNETSWNGTSGEVKDQTQFANNGTGSGGVTTTSSGKYSYAGSFDGTDDVVTTPDTSSLTLSSPFSISVWVYPTALPTSGNLMSIVSKYDGGANAGGYDLRLYNESGTQKIGLTTLTSGGTPGGGDVTYTLTTNTWSLITGIYDGTNSIIYVNGVRIGAVANTANPGDNTKLLNIGNFGYYTVTATTLSRYFAGRIDEVRLYNKILNTNQINTLYSTGPEGTLAGSTKPTWQTENQCISEKCLYFNGTSSYVLTPNSANSNFTGTAPFTVSAWVKPSSYPDVHVIVGKYNANVGGQWMLYLNSSGKVVFHREVSPWGLTGNTTLDPNKWYFVTGVYDGTNMQIFVNGKPDSPITASGSVSSDSTNVLIGAYYSSGTPVNFFNGFIDEVKIYNYARSTSQLALDYNSRGSVLGSSTNFGSNLQNNPNLIDKLGGWWKMDAGSGTTTSDSSGNGNTSSAFTGNVAWTSGKYQNGLSFDGTNDVVQVVDATSIDVGGTTSSYTIATWIKTTANFSDDASLMEKNDSNGAYPFALRLNSNEVPKFIVSDGTNSPTITGTTALNDGNWHHVVGVRDVNTDGLYLYVDGVLIRTTQDTTSGSIANNDDLSFGNGGGSYQQYDFNGTLDEARLYNRALSQTEIVQLYNMAPPPYVYLDFENGSGLAVPDKSGNGYSGTWNGTTTNVWGPGQYGKGAVFNGSNNYISFSNLPKPGNLPLTIMFWMKPNSTTPVGIYDSAPSTADVLRNFTSGNIEWWNATPRLPLNATASTWQHVAIVYNHDGTNRVVSYYKNGALQQTVTVSGTSSYGWSNFVLGNINGGGDGWYSGSLDEFKIYTYARTPQQIVEDMNGGHPPPGSPVGSPLYYFKFDQGYGTTTNSSGSVSTVSGTLTNMSSPATPVSGWTKGGRFNGAINFDGGNDSISVTTIPEFNVRQSDSFTVSAWIKRTASGATHTVVSKQQNVTNEFSYGLFVNSSNLPSFDVSKQNIQAGTAVGTTTIQTNTWYYLTGVYDGTQTKIYVNGKLEGTTPITFTSATINAANIDIGQSYVGTNRFQGVIDELKFFNSALTDAQIALDMNRGAGQTLASLSTDTNGTTASAAASREYCVPGDTTSCSTPILEWRMEEGTGTSANDSSGNNITGTLTNGPLWAPGKFGKGVWFDGSADFITGGDAASLDFGTSDFSISYWIKTTKATRFDMIQKNSGTGGNGSYSIYWSSSSNMTFHTDNGSGGNSTVTWASPNINDGKWHHIVAVRSGTTMTIYSDGMVAAIGTGLTVRSISGTGNFCVGKHCQDNNFFVSGTMDNVRVYNYARSLAQVAWEYNKGGPTGWWKMDECQGNTINDATGNSLTGTWSGSGGSQTTAGTCTTNASTAWYNGRNGKINSSLNFDGTDDIVTVTNSSTLNRFLNPNGAVSGGKDLTIAGWFKTTATDNWMAIASSNDPGTSGYLLSFNDTNQIGCYKIGIVALATPTSISSIIQNGQWHHVACATDSTGMYLYVDGVLQASNGDTTAYGANASSVNFSIGYNLGEGSDPFNGQLDDIRLYQYRLTTNQIKTLYNEGAVRYAPVTGTP